MAKILENFHGKYPISNGDYFFAESFLKLLAFELKHRHIDKNDFKEDVLKKTQSFFKENIHLITDRQSQSHILMCAFVLAAVFQIEVRSGDGTTAYSIVECAFTKFGRFWTKLGTRFALFFSRDKLKTIKESAEKRSASVYGNLFEIVGESDGNDFYSSNVKRCGYFDFFKANGRPDLTKIMCKWDRNWANEIDPKKHRIQFSRPATIADGNEICCFMFTRTAE